MNMNRRRSAGTTAVRRYRANAENRTRENRNRVIDRIAGGARPRESTLKRYDIQPQEVDAAREAVGLPPLFSDNTYQSTAVLQNINEVTQREINEVAKQKRLIVELEQNQDRLRELQIDAERENQGRVVRVPAAQLYNIFVMQKYLRANDDRKASEKTRTLAYGPQPTAKKQNVRSGQLYALFKKYYENKGITDQSWENDISGAIKDMPELIEAAGQRKGRGSGPLSPPSLVTPLRMLSVAMELYPQGRSLAKQFQTEYAILQQIKLEYELKSQAYLESKKADEELPFDWDEVENIVTGKFGYLSKEDMYIKFFSEAPSRDDLGDLRINPADSKGNFIRISNDGQITFHLNEYKTSRAYGSIKTKLSRELSAQVREYIRLNNLRDGDALFGAGKMGPFVSKLVTDAGIRVANQRGGINLLRRIYVSHRVRAGLSQMERFELALAMKHTPLATLKYVRQFKDKTDDAAANNELPRNY